LPVIFGFASPKELKFYPAEVDGRSRLHAAFALTGCATSEALKTTMHRRQRRCTVRFETRQPQARGKQRRRVRRQHRQRRRCRLDFPRGRGMARDITSPRGNEHRYITPRRRTLNDGRHYLAFYRGLWTNARPIGSRPRRPPQHAAGIRGAIMLYATPEEPRKASTGG
jgi:hypothetical protein